MSQDTNEVEDVVETPAETETVEETIDEVEEDANIPTLEDYKALEKKAATLEAQKEHWRKKAEPALKSAPAETNKPNTNDSISRDEVYLITKGIPLEVLDEAKLVAQVKGISLKEAIEYPTIKAFADQLSQKEKSEKAQLGASGGGSGKSTEILDSYAGKEEEHRKLFEKLVK